MRLSNQPPTSPEDTGKSSQLASPISVRVTATDKERFPDLDNIQSIVLRDGPRVRKEAKFSAIRDRHTQEIHHYALSIQTYRKKAGESKYDKEHSISLTSEGEDEIQKLTDFLQAVRADSTSKDAHYLIVKAPEKAADKAALETILSQMSGDGKATVMAEILERSSRDEAFLNVLLERAARNPQLFAEAAAALNLATYRAAVKKLTQLVNAAGKVRESAFQELLEENPWLFGSEYSELLGRRRLTRDELQDFVVRRTTDGDIELVEIKTPLAGANLFNYDASHKSYFAGTDLSKVVGQVQNYIEKIDAERHSIFANDGEDTCKIKAKIIIGRDGDSDQQAALRRFNGHLHRIEVLTFDQLLKIAERVLSYLEGALRPLEVEEENGEGVVAKPVSKTLAAILTAANLIGESPPLMKITLFAKGQLREVLDTRLREIATTIASEKSDYLLGTNETLYVQHMVSLFTFQVPVIHYEKQSVSAIEKQIPSHLFSHAINTTAGKTYLRQVLVIHLPVEGQIDLLRYCPSTFIHQNPEVETKEGEISFEVINLNDDVAHLKSQVERVVNAIRPMADNIQREVEGFNASLEEITARLRSRKSDLQRQQGVLGQLGIPVRPSASVPSTFAIPRIVQKILIKPPAPVGSFVPEPSLEIEIYTQILQVIRDLGREMERHPSIYRDRDEEALRDLFLLQLSTHFESVSGETFNKRGKTDILVRYEGKNAFVAECKIWKGANEFSKAIDQLLSYLTWRDSKTSLMLFVRNKELQKVLDTVPKTVRQHSSFVATKANPEEGWFSFELHLPDDPSRAVHLAVMLFHFPD